MPRRSAEELALIESVEYQAISKTRLWKEIFYLRHLLDDKTTFFNQMEQQMRDMEAQLEAER